MPSEMERKLMTEALKKGLSKKRTGAYVYGTMQKTTNWKPGMPESKIHGVKVKK
jgi:hypothetical protein